MKENKKKSLNPRFYSTSGNQKNNPKDQSEAVFYSNQFTISNLPVECHPKIDAILSATGRLSEALNIKLEKDSYAAHTNMTAYLYPKSEIYRIVLVNVFYDLLYYIDDIFGEDIQDFHIAEQPNLQEVMSIWFTGNINADYYKSIKSPRIKSICTAVQWTRTKISQTCEPEFFQMLSNALFEHLKEQLQPEPYKDLASYITLRRKFSGMYVVIHLIEYCYRCYLTKDILEKAPSIQVVIDKCADISGLGNDVISYPKEKHSKLNLINVLLDLKVVQTFNEAIQTSIDLVNELHLEVDEAIAKTKVEIQVLSNEDRTKVLQFIEGINSILSASYHWQLVTQRYRHENHILADLRVNVDYKGDAA
ncbi:MAG: terpene synthase family protein [Aureispira sp.]